MLIAGLGIPIWIVIALKLKPVRGHLQSPGADQVNPFRHLWKTVSRKDYLIGFTATTLLATGGFMLMPFSSAFSVHNLGVQLEELPWVYLVTGLFTMVAAPLIGKFSDRVGKFAVFAGGSLAGLVLVWVYTNLPPSPLWVVILVTVVLFIAITSRMISSQALLTSVPEPKDRGAFLSLNASLAQLSGGLAAVTAGYIVIERPDGGIDRYDILGYVVMGAMLITLIQFAILNRQLRRQKG
jgi:predicted MFS family arabinose efflux permease